MAYFSIDFNLTYSPLQQQIDLVRRRLNWGRPMALGLIGLLVALLMGGLFFLAIDGGRTVGFWADFVVVCGAMWLMRSANKFRCDLNASAKALQVIEPHLVDRAISLAGQWPSIDAYRRAVAAHRVILMGDFDLMCHAAEKEEAFAKGQEVRHRQAEQMSRLHSAEPIENPSAPVSLQSGIARQECAS